MAVTAVQPRPHTWPAGELRRVRERLVTPLPAGRLFGWLGPLLVTGFAGLLRFSRLGTPRGLVFDEVYYAHDSYSLLLRGVELNNRGNGPGFVVHPPLGKWLIAAGEWLFSGHQMLVKGTTYPSGAFGWRFSAAVVGTLAVLLVARAARRMFRSTLLGCVAGLLLALDGLEFVQSRVSMLDIFLMFWLVAGFAALVVDRDDGRRRMAERLHPDSWRASRGPFLGARWWRVLAGVCLGAACATKWSAIWYLPGFLLLAYVWDLGARKTAGTKQPWRGALLLDLLPSLVPLVVVPTVVYTASWTGWFLATPKTAYDYPVLRAGSWWSHLSAVFGGWIKYQRAILHFHVTLQSTHPYESGPFGWLLLARPVAYYYASPQGCGASSCSQEVLGIGTPAIWWASIPALVWMCWLLISRVDWRALAILVGFAAGYLPWFLTPERTMFLFYALPSVPFMVLALTFCAGQVLGRASPHSRRSVVGAVLVGGYLCLTTLNFFYFYPVLAGQNITYAQWQDRMWFQNCSGHSQHHESAPCWI